MRASTDSGTFLLELLKPSHYDDDGYVIQWWRGSVPSNSLSTLYGLALDAQQRQVLGRDVVLDVQVRDETTEVLPLRRIIRRFERNGRRGLVCLVGVQTNQFPRALDIARQLRAAGIQVAIGGFHVSGCLAMLPELPADLQEAQALGICLFAGEAEGRLDELLRAADTGQLAPLYDFMKDLPGLESQPLPFLPQSNVQRYLGNIASFDAGRGCPFSCSFCTIINVQGRKSRYRTADDVERLIRANAAHGHQELLHHRRQLRPQQELGGDPRPHHRAAARARPEDPPQHAGRHLLPQDSQLRRQGRARRLHQGLHRPGEHQPGQSQGRLQGAEPDQRVSRRCCRPGGTRAY